MQNKYTDNYFDSIFTYHPPNEEQKIRYQNIREAAKIFAKVVYENTPSSPDQSVALRKIREAVMTANASIALNGMC
jgi:hypothetical protein